MAYRGFTINTEKACCLIDSPLSMSYSDVSIIIPVKDNQEGLNRLLEYLFKYHNLEKNNLPKDIIIVDNNSKVQISIDSKFLQIYKRIKLLSCVKKGPGAARNHGAKYSTGKWLLFMDSDCIPTQNTIKNYFNSLNGSIGYSGQIKSWRTGIISKFYNSANILSPLINKVTLKPMFLVTANCLVYKRAFNYINGFNEDLYLAGGEDLDLGIRLSEIGALSFSNSFILHDYGYGIVPFVKRFFRYGKALGKLMDIQKKQGKLKINFQFEYAQFDTNELSNIFLTALYNFSFYLGYILPDKRTNI